MMRPSRCQGARRTATAARSQQLLDQHRKAKRGPPKPQQPAIERQQPATRSALLAQLLAYGLSLVQADALAERQHAASTQEA